MATLCRSEPLEDNNEQHMCLERSGAALEPHRLPTRSCSPPTLSCGGALGPLPHMRVSPGRLNPVLLHRDPARFSAPQGGLVHLDSSPGTVHTFLRRTADLGKSKQRLCCWLCCLRPHKLRGPRWDEQMAVTSRAQKAEGSCLLRWITAA